MKQIVIAGLLAAIGAVVMTNGASAESRYCYDNPDDGRCALDPDYSPRRALPPPPGADDYSDDPDVGYDRRRPPRPPLLGDYDAPRPPGAWGPDSRRRYCWRVGQSLREYGYRRVRPIDCEGSSFRYTAFLGYERYTIMVRARSGRIVYERPN